MGLFFSCTYMRVAASLARTERSHSSLVMVTCQQ